MEIELKLRFRPEMRARLDRHPAIIGLGSSPPRTERQVTTYFDTGNQALAAHGYTLRVRRSGGRRVQTLKAEPAAATAGDDGPARHRGEWEWPVEDDVPDLALLAGTPLAAQLGGVTGAHLAPVVTTDISRVTRRLRLDGGAVVEAAIDEGTLRAGGAEQPVRELELELKDGPVAPLYRLAVALHDDLAFHIGLESKAARGFRLRSGRRPEAMKPVDPALDGGVEGIAALRRIVGGATRTLLGNEAAALVGDAEGVHEMRVAIRRLRAALTLFAPLLDRHGPDRFNDELRRLGRILGAARDWDVFVLQTLPATLGSPDGAVWRDMLHRAAQAERAGAHARLAEALETPALTGLALALAAWAEEPPERIGHRALRRPLCDLAPGLLDRAAKKVARRGRGVAALSPPELHALRKSVKKLRYGVDFLGGAYPPKAVRRYRKRCKALQEELGALNDAAVAITFGETLGSEDVDLVPGVAVLGRRSETVRRRTLKRLPGVWDAFREAPAFWR